MSNECSRPMFKILRFNRLDDDEFKQLLDVMSFKERCDLQRNTIRVKSIKDTNRISKLGSNTPYAWLRENCEGFYYISSHNDYKSDIKIVFFEKDDLVKFILTFTYQ